MDVVDVSIPNRCQSSRFGWSGALARVTLATGLLACGGDPADQPEPLEGVDLVAGTSIDRRGLLVIPSAGGVAEFRALDAPSTVRWTGRLSLPPPSAAYPLGRAVVVRHEGGASLYSPAPPEALTELPPVGEAARWIDSPGGGAFVENGRALIVTPDGAREILEEEGRFLWAAPAAGGRAVALIESGSTTQLAVWEPDDEDAYAAHKRTVDSRGPALLAGWGREVVLASQDGSGLTGWSVPELEREADASTDGPPGALAVSPSQHRIFAASAGRPRLAIIDRYDWRTSRTARFDGPLREVRSGVLGERFLAFDGEGVWAVRIDDAEAESLPFEWRPDLPLALPGDRILGVVAGELRLLSPEGGDLAPVDGPVDAWWLPLRWGPRAPVAGAAVNGEALPDEEARTDSAGRRVGLTTMGRVSARRVAESPGRSLPGADPRPRAPEAEGAAVPVGFYAVATSSRRPERLRELRRALEESGYRTEVLPRVDEANEVWYRLMVGPYDSRAAAEGAARQLRRERGIDAWIREVTDSGGGGR